MHDELLALYERACRIEIEEPDARREIQSDMVRQVGLLRPASYIAWSNLRGTDVDARIDAEIAYFRALGHQFEWTVYDHDYPPDLGQRLLAHGFTIDEEPGTILVLDLHALPDALRGPTTHDIRRITDPDDVRAVLGVQQAVWGLDFERLIDELAGYLHDQPDFLTLFAAYVDGLPVSSAWTKYPPGNPFGFLYGGSTLPDYRGRGIYTALVAARAGDALARGRRYLTVDDVPASATILTRLGFQAIAGVTAYTWTLPGG